MKSLFLMSPTLTKRSEMLQINYKDFFVFHVSSTCDGVGEFRDVSMQTPPVLLPSAT